MASSRLRRGSCRPSSTLPLWSHWRPMFHSRKCPLFISSNKLNVCIIRSCVHPHSWHAAYFMNKSGFDTSLVMWFSRSISRLHNCLLWPQYFLIVRLPTTTAGVFSSIVHPTPLSVMMTIILDCTLFACIYFNKYIQREIRWSASKNGTFSTSPPAISHIIRTFHVEVYFNARAADRKILTREIYRSLIMDSSNMSQCDKCTSTLLRIYK